MIPSSPCSKTFAAKPPCMGCTVPHQPCRIDEVTQQLGIADRMSTATEELSGGLKRRVELAKGILHRPRLLLMDEPSTGLDLSSRLDLWHALQDLRTHSQVTVLLTTHLLEEADKADRIAIMHEGQTVAVGCPSELASISWVNRFEHSYA
ncbi:MAG: ABC transporter ATP-binding protein [Pirellulaceae bacterium]